MAAIPNSSRRSGRFSLRIGNRLDTPAGKRRFAGDVFEAIADEYDAVTPPLSLWRDRAWKRTLVAALPDRVAPVCLDLACGTGDLAFLLAARYPGAHITGVDISPRMLERARFRNRWPPVCFIRQEMDCLPVEAGSVDIVTGGYALRNAPVLAAALHEIARVLKPGGVAAFLDFSKPAHPLGQSLELALLRAWCGAWGWLLHRNPDAYRYIAATLAGYPDRRGLHDILAEHGLAVVRSRLFFAGVIELLIAQRRPEELSQAM